MSVIGTLAAWAAETPDDWSPLALARARDAVEDLFACMIAGTEDEATVRVRSAIAHWGGDGATVAGQAARAAAPWAAFANGTAAHALDFDDNFLPSMTHASAVLVSALLAVGEGAGASGRRLLDVYIVGLEMHAKLGLGVNRSHYNMGWHATSTIGTIGTAAACARLLDLDARQPGNAMSLGVSMASGVKVQFGSNAKPRIGRINALMPIRLTQLHTTSCGWSVRTAS
jgi:2-methylcitrate dehydratase PrpD